MKIKVDYIPNSSVNSNTTTIQDIPAEESFQDVLVLNQAALKAMTIDAMVDKSATNSVNPDVVDAAAIMAFRSTLPSNIVAPIPEEDVDLGNPYKPPVVEKDTSAVEEDSSTVEEDSSTVDTESNTPEVDDSKTEPATQIYNEGALKCSDELNNYFSEAAEKYGVDAKLIKAIACAESNFDPTATSKSGAMGIMQMMPSTAKECGVEDPYDPRQSIMGGTYYISQMLERYDGDVSLALAAYNAGANNVDKYGGIPPFEQTQNYVKKVVGYYNL